jgi:hypothetical protein
MKSNWSAAVAVAAAAVVMVYHSRYISEQYVGT